VPPLFGSGGRGTLAGERRGGRVLIPTSGHTLWYSLYMYFVDTGENTDKAKKSLNVRVGYKRGE
jgi:hypothetical protein